MDELVAQQREREAAEAAEAPRDKNAEVALKVRGLLTQQPCCLQRVRPPSSSPHSSLPRLCSSFEGRRGAAGRRGMLSLPIACQSVFHCS